MAASPNLRSVRRCCRISEGDAWCAQLRAAPSGRCRGCVGPGPPCSFLPITPSSGRVCCLEQPRGHPIGAGSHRLLPAADPALQWVLISGSKASLCLPQSLLCPAPWAPCLGNATCWQLSVCGSGFFIVPTLRCQEHPLASGHITFYVNVCNVSRSLLRRLEECVQGNCLPHPADLTI